MSRVLARAALVGAAIVAVAWLGHGMRALDLAAQGNATLAAAGRPPGARAVEEARSSFRAAGRWNPDPAPTLDEATLLMSTGRAREAGPMLEDMTRVNPGNVRAWSLLAAATARSAPSRSDAALRELASLYGRIQTGPLIPSALQAPDGRFYRVVTKTGQGLVDLSDVGAEDITLAGWAADVRARRTAERVLVVSRNRVVAATRPSGPRPDLARRYGPKFGSSGFTVSFPRRRAEDDDGKLDVQVFAVSANEAARIRFFCPSDNQDLGC